MKIACLVSSLSRNAGGIHESVRRLCQSLQARPSTEVHVLGTSDEHTHEDLPAWSPLQTHVFAVRGPSRFGYAPRLQEKLLALDADLLMTHGLWMYPSLVALAWHRRTRRPFLIHPHGMLDSWAKSQSRLKKKLAGFLYENACLRSASCVRALALAEVESLRAHGLTNPICVLPNGIDLPQEQAAPPPWRKRVAAGRHVLLYLGRIHPKKGLPDLLRAWNLLRARRPDAAKNWELVLAGWDQDGHAGELRALARELGLEATVHFVGPQFGPDKAATYACASAFVLPSLSEGLPMAVLEAWAHQLPVLMTPACHFPEAFEMGAALYAQPDVDSLARGLETLFSMSDAERRRMGDRACLFARADQFNWSQIGTQMHDVCRWLVGEISRPECVLPEPNESPTCLPAHESSLA